MGRKAVNWPLRLVRLTTWEGDFFQYVDENDQPVDLSGYEARMQIRTEQARYGQTTTATLLLELTTANGMLVWHPTELGRVDIAVDAADTAVLNPKNLRRQRYAYWLEVYRPAPDADTPEYVIPLAEGTLTVYARGYR
ncbi:MAG TPA: hypothetical protein VFE72_02805 [Lysobacter sp.]|nr:hypothetical protein [Lysobacter sp.]